MHHLYVIRVGERDAKLAQLQSHHIGAGVHYPFPVHQLDAYRDVAVVRGSLNESDAWAAECLSLPMFPELTEAQIEFVAEHIPRRRARLAA